MKTIACVYWQGEFYHNGAHRKYEPRHVHALRDQVAKNLKIPHRFVCLTNVPYELDCETVTLAHDWHGWWSKIELFRPGLLHDAFYIDLDTVIVGDITHMVQHQAPFTTLRDERTGFTFNSSIMSWQGDYSFLYTRFAADTEHYMKIYRKMPRLGDQGYIQDRVPDVDCFYKLFPGQILTYRWELEKGKVPPPADCRIVLFHGNIKPWNTSHEWIPNSAR